MAHHGNTPAAWTGVLVILVGFVIGVLGPVVGKIMQKMGLGAEPVSAQRH